MSVDTEKKLMTAKGRFIKAVNHKQPDKVPYDVAFTIPARKRMVDFYGDENFESRLNNCFVWYKPTPNGTPYIEIEKNIWKDEFGVLWDRTIEQDIGNVCNRVITSETMHDYQWPDASDPTRYSPIQRLIDENPDKVIGGRIGFTIFDRAWTLVGMENLLMMMVTDKYFIHKLMDKCLEFALEVIERSCKYDIDVFRLGDDWGQQHGLIMGPELWREFIKPRMKEIFQLIKSKGKYSILHSCGKVDEIFPDLIEIGLDIFNPFQPEVTDVAEVKKKYGDKLTFFGGISTQKTLPYGTVQETKDEVKRLIDVIGENGGWIASPAHDIPADAKPENIDAMIEVLINQ
jgi:uroporphyrinogen decarboxylase